ncbi:MAG: hypothetical protein ACD_77C00014G0003 [uncultured bacterium]|nr:MAG: hypothetical protein ACD_77C00014G0003 [uncultured bacterium]
MASMSRTMFLLKVCQLVSFITSPKHPQSAIGSKSARNSVNIVKNEIKIKDALHANFILKPSRREIPMSISAPAIKAPNIIGKAVLLSIPIILKYSATISPPPTGSMSFTKPEKRKVRPNTTLAIALNNFIS